MKYNEFRCPDCDSIMTSKFGSGIFECKKCGKKYKFKIKFFKTLIFIFIFITIPVKLIDSAIAKLDFVHYKFLVLIIIDLIYGAILLFSSLCRIIYERFEIINWVEIKDNNLI